MKPVPHTVRAALAKAAVEHFSRAEMCNAFEVAGFQPANGYSKTDLARAYLGQLDAHPEPWCLVEEMLRNIFNAPWHGVEQPVDRMHTRQVLVNALATCDLAFEGKKLIGLEVRPEATFDEAVRRHDMASVVASFDRAAANISRDPEDAITAACALLESLFKIILGDDGIELPAEQSIRPLWKAVRDHLELAADQDVARHMKLLLGGLASVVHGVGDFRTEMSDAHGRGRGAPRPEARHARLAVQAAQIIATFLLETWEVKVDPRRR